MLPTGDVQTFEMFDDIIKVKISKVDITTNEELPGAELVIKDKDGNEIDRWISTNKPHYVEKIPAGDYTLTEITAPSGYKIAESINFTVLPTGEIQTVVMKDAREDTPTPTPDNTPNPEHTPQPTPDTTPTPTPAPAAPTATPGELPEHSRFIHETAIPYFEQRGIPTRVLRSEKTYLSCFYHVVTRGKTKGMLSGFPLSGRCTIQRDCKLPPIKAYQKALPPDTVQYIGIAADEPKRLARLKPGQISLLDKYHVAEPEARSMCAAEELLSPLYDFTKRGGCWFCPNASISELRHLYRYHPELWQLLLELQDVPNKPTERFSWRRTFREIDERFLQEGEQLSFYEER